MIDQYLASRLGQQKAEFRKRIRGRVRVLLWLIPTMILSLWLAFMLRFDGSLEDHQSAAFWKALPLVLAVKLVIFGLAKVSRVWHAFASLHDTARFLRAVAVATAGVAAADLFVNSPSLLPRGVILIDGCLTTLLITGLLSIHRLRRERKHRGATADGQAMLIVGSVRSSESFLQAIRCRPSSKHHPVGLVADQPQMLHREIAGVPVVGIVETDNVAAAAAEAGAETVMVISGDLPGPQIRQIMADCKQADLPIQVIPEVGRIVDGQVEIQPREVAIEDLLGRQPVSLDQDDLYEWLHDQTILVTGSCGSIGSEISRQLLRFTPRKLILLDRSETGQFFLGRELNDAVEQGQVEIIVADTTDLARLQRIFMQHRPQTVFHAAAYKHVPLMEQHPGEAVKNIIGSTRHVADLSARFGVESFVMVSTDKAVNPTNVMGCCKRVAELYVQSLADNGFEQNAKKTPTGKAKCRFVTVRFGNVLGSAGSVIPVFREQIARGGPLTLTHPDMTRFFMTIPEASQLVIQAGRQGNGGEIFVLDMGEPVKIIDLARDMIKLSGLQPDEDIEIEISGLRPGEKLYEELYADEETRQPTHHPKILVAESVAVQKAELVERIENLMTIAEGSSEAVRQTLQQLVPGYRPQSDGRFGVRPTAVRGRAA